MSASETVTVSNTTTGETSTAPAKTITVTDPPVTASLSPSAKGGAAGSIDFSGTSFGANTTLAYSQDGTNSGGALTVSNGLHPQSIALLSQYMASSFVSAGVGHGTTLITDPPPSQDLLLAHPHA